MSFSRKAVVSSKRIVVKLGSALLTSMKSPEAEYQRFAKDICGLRDNGRHISLVSSGAIAQGAQMLGYAKRPPGFATAQGLAALGQPVILERWAKAFAPTQIAQLLLDKYDISNPTSFLNARRALRSLEDKNVIPIGNENDAVVNDSIKIGDNDTLSAHVARIANADLLILLTQVDGLYTANPESDPSATLIKTIESHQLDYAIQVSGSESSDGLGTGGFATKIQAVNLAFEHSIPVVIANGKIDKILNQIMDGSEVGTLFTPPKTLSRKSWLSEYWPIDGRIVVNDNILDTIQSANPSGIWLHDVVAVEGKFVRGQCIEIAKSDGRIIGRGLCGYGSNDIKKLQSLTQQKVLAELGPKKYDGELFHSDDYVCF